jgi:hypothetical protein
MKIKALVKKHLSEHSHAAGETVQFGWFVFQIAKVRKELRVQSLDFRGMASFTDDFSEAERIYALQNETLSRHKVPECPCTLEHTALISMSYTPARKDVFLKRDRPTDEHDSGWYVGVYDDPLDMNDVESFARVSLYELTISDMRMAPYWLLPIGTLVSLHDGEVKIRRQRGSPPRRG